MERSALNKKSLLFFSLSNLAMLHEHAGHRLA